MTEIDTTEAAVEPAAETADRAARRKYYFDDDGVLTRFVKGEDPVPLPIPEDQVMAYAFEGRRILDISGRDFTNFTKPAPKPTRATGGGRGPSLLTKAIAAAKLASLTKEARANGGRPTKADLEALQVKALEFAQGLSKELKEKASGTTDVMIQLAQLRGTGESLDDIMSTGSGEEETAIASDETQELSIAAE